MKLRCSRTSISICALLCLCALSIGGQGDPPQPIPAPRYRVTDLGPALYAQDDVTPVLAANGDTAVWRRDAENRIRTRFSPEGHRAAPSSSLPGYPDLYVADIDADGAMVGMCKKPEDARYARAFLYREGRLIDLGTLGGNYARAYAVRGQVVGAADTADGHIHAFLCAARDSTKLRDLGVLPGGDYSSARGINRLGQAVGVANVASNGGNHAFLWERGQMRDLGLLPAGSFSHAQAINNAGLMVGWANTHGETHAVLWRGDRAEDLGVDLADTSAAWDINGRGQIVGAAAQGGLHKQMHACLWEAGHPFDLNRLVPAAPDQRLQYAYRINDRGQILALGTLHGAIHAYLLTPLAPVANW